MMKMTATEYIRSRLLAGVPQEEEPTGDPFRRLSIEAIRMVRDEALTRRDGETFEMFGYTFTTPTAVYRANSRLMFGGPSPAGRAEAMANRATRMLDEVVTTCREVPGAMEILRPQIEWLLALVAEKTKGRADTVLPEQVRQERPGDVTTGSIPYRVVARDWIFADTWIVQSLLGGLTRKKESEILAHPIWNPEVPDGRGQALRPGG